MHVVDPASLGRLVCHDHPHGGHLGLGVGAQAANVRRVAFRVGQDQNTGQPLHALERERPLLREFLPPPVAPRPRLVMTSFGLRQAALGAGSLPLHVLSGAADLLVDAQQHLS